MERNSNDLASEKIGIDSPFEQLIEKPKGFIQLTSLLLFSFSSAFLPRLLLKIKFPSLVTLFYLFIIPAIAILVLTKTKLKDRKQTAIVWELIIALMIFFGVNVTSALYNQGALINACFNFLFFGVHFIFLVSQISLPVNPENVKRFRDYVVFCSFTNLVFALIQGTVFRTDNPDDVKGVFFEGGAGHVLGASVSLTFGAYYFVSAKHRPLWLRSAVVLATIVHMNMADAKQAMLVFAAAGALLFILKLQNIGAAIKYLIGGGLLGYAFFWATQNFPALKAFNTWMRPEIYGPQGEATLLKTAAFRVVNTYFHSPFDSWFGLGPGHTVGRLGGWMLDKYADMLLPLGATIHPASKAVWKAAGESWLGNQSSMFSPFFGWAAIWGDLGWLGLISFLYIWFVIWRRLCFDEVSKFLLLTPLVFGLIFTQMEEPGYMVYVATIIGLRWQEHQCRRNTYKAGRDVQFNREA